MPLKAQDGKVVIASLAALPAAGAVGTLLVTANHIFFDDGTVQRQLDQQVQFGRLLVNARGQFWTASAF